MAQIKGIDVSRYQGTIEWAKVKADGVKFAMLKTVSTNKSFGGIYIDPSFERNYSECKRLGIPVGVYYYTYAQDKATADKELAKLQEAIKGKQFEYPIVVDVEDNLLKPLSAAALTDLVIYALKKIESWGCYAMLYTYASYRNTELEKERLTPYDLWIAHYTTKRPSYTHGMWQYTSTGKVAGISGNVDLNWAYKDYPSIIKSAGLNGWPKSGDSTTGQGSAQEPGKLQKPTVRDITKGDYDALVALAKQRGLSYSSRFTIRFEPMSQSNADAVLAECKARGLDKQGLYTSDWV